MYLGPALFALCEMEDLPGHDFYPFYELSLQSVFVLAATPVFTGILSVVASLCIERFGGVLGGAVAYFPLRCTPFLTLSLCHKIVPLSPLARPFQLSLDLSGHLYLRHFLVNSYFQILISQLLSKGEISRPSHRFSLRSFSRTLPDSLLSFVYDVEYFCE